MHRTRYILPQAELLLIRDAIPQALAARAFDELRRGLPWRQEEITLFGKRVMQPRLLSWHGDSGAVYRYSFVTHEPQPWTPLLLELREIAQALSGSSFNSVLANLYRDGADSNGWHADNEPELGKHPLIASLSFGATRDFRLKHRDRQVFSDTLTIPLAHASMLIMRGGMQAHWLHELPKRKRVSAARINLTFRAVVGRERGK